MSQTTFNLKSNTLPLSHHTPHQQTTFVVIGTLRVKYMESKLIYPDNIFNALVHN